MRSSCLGLACLFFTPGLFAQENDLPAPVRLESGVSGHIHPVFAVTKKGTLVAAYCKSEYRPYLITRSTDGGKSWSKPALFPPTEKTSLYPGSLTTLADGRLVHAWNVWYDLGPKRRSRYVAYSISDDDGVTWSEPKNLAKSKDDKIESVIRHPIVELSADAWLWPLMDRTIVYNPQTGEETPFGDGRNHGLVPIVRTAKGTLISGKGLRSTDGGKTWHDVKPFPDVSSQGWRQQMIGLKNGLLLASQSIGPGVGGNKIHYIVSRDDGKTWDMDHPVEFYNPGRAIGGRACPRSADIDDRTLGTVFYDVDAKQPGGAGVFFRSMPIARLASTLQSGEPTKAKVRILLLGDSTVIGSVCRREAPKADHLEDVIRKLLAAEGDLPPAEVINQGRDGEFIQGLLAGRYDKEIATLPRVDIVLIRYGLNDWGRRKDFAENFPRDCQDLIHRLQKDHPGCQIVLEPVIPYFGAEETRKINDLIRGVAAAEKLPVLDTHARFAAELKHGPNMLTYRRVSLKSVPKKYHALLSPRSLKEGSVVAMDNTLDAHLRDVPGWFGDRHPNIAGYHVIGAEAARFLAPLIRDRLKAKNASSP